MQLEELQKSIGFVVGVPGTVPSDLHQQLSALSHAYNSRHDALVKMEMMRSAEPDCDGGLTEEVSPLNYLRQSVDFETIYAWSLISPIIIVLFERNLDFCYFQHLLLTCARHDFPL
jgi:hypothetical protein